MTTATVENKARKGHYVASIDGTILVDIVPELVADKQGSLI